MRPTNSPATGAGALNRFNSAPTSLLESLIETENEGEVDNDGGVLEALLDEAVFLASQGMSVSCSDSRSIRSPNEVSPNHHNRPDYEALERMKIKDSSSMFLPTGFDSIGKYESPVDHSHTVVTGSMDDLWKLQPQNRPVSIAENFPSPKRGLVRHNSTPPDFLNQISSDLSRGDGYLLAMAPPVSESYINPGMSGSVSPMSGGYSGTESVSHFPQVSKSMTNVQTEHDTSGRLARRGGLARHSSLPGEFISQLASDLGKIEENCNGFGAADDSLMARKRFRVPEQSSTSTDPSDYILEQLNSRFTASLHESPDSPLPANTTTCQLRAKRGYATHPRSIAERQRRTRISEGIKKLQDLVPNVDKNLNTAEMLDEAVEYIKFLQRQVQELSLNSPPRSA